MQNNNNNVIYAGFFVRLAAYIIDSIIIGTVLLIIKIPKLIVSLVNPDVFLLRPLIFKFSVVDIFLYLLSLTYFVLMTYLFGATLGKKLLKIRVCKEDNKKLSFIDVLYRESIGRYLSTITIFIGYIMIGVDSKKRGLHDILCDTRVVYNFNFAMNNNNNVNMQEDNVYTERQAVLESQNNNISQDNNNNMSIYKDSSKGNTDVPYRDKTSINENINSTDKENNNLSNEDNL